MSLASLKTLSRQFSKVPASVVSQLDANGVTSDETVAILDAVREYSGQNPRLLVVSGTMTTGFEVGLTSLVSDWHQTTHSVRRIWWPVDLQGKYEIQPSDFWLYQKPDGTQWIKFTISVPEGAFYVEYCAYHVVSSVSDTLSSAAPHHVEAVGHLAASNILRMAANHYAQQFTSSISADTVDPRQQASAYAKRSEDERLEYSRRLHGVESGGGFVDWGYPAPGNDDYFWRSRRYR